MSVIPYVQHQAALRILEEHIAKLHEALAEGREYVERFTACGIATVAESEWLERSKLLLPIELR